MKRLFTPLLALYLLMLFVFPVQAEEPPVLDEPLAGVICYPEGSDETSALYVYRYSYPRVAGNSELAELINGVYEYQVEDAIAFRAPMAAEGIDPASGVQESTTITHEITCLNERYLSVKLTTVSAQGASVSTIVSANVFALTGPQAGNVTSLPYLLGLLDPDDETADEWLKNRQTTKADDCVRGLIWAIIEQQRADGSVAYDDDLTYETFADSFYPEEDFYLDADGNPVFFIQEAFIAPAAEGVLSFPFTLEELLDEL